jgi:hypothetical protein
MSLPKLPKFSKFGGCHLFHAWWLSPFPRPFPRKANRINIRHPDGTLIAVIELVSPGNKESQHAVRSFACKAVEFLRAGIHLLIVDLFPPSKRDPQGLHKLIWDRIKDEPYELPADKPLTLAAYSSGSVLEAFVENIGVGDELPDMPIFLTPDRVYPLPTGRHVSKVVERLPKGAQGASRSVPRIMTLRDSAHQ